MRTFNEMLTDYNRIKFELRVNKQKQNELLELNGLPKKQDVTVYDPNRVSKPTETLGMVLCALFEKENEIIVRLNAVREEIDTCLLLHLSCEKFLCVQGKLLNGYSFTELAEKMSYSRGHLVRLYNGAMEVLKTGGHD